MRAVIVGAVESTRVALRTIAAEPGWEVAAVVTLPPGLACRHSDFADVAGEATKLGVRAIHAPNGNAPEVIDAIEGLKPDYLFVVGWSQLCGPAFVATAPGRVIGYHPAPLPRLRGRAAIPWTILMGEAISGGTLFWIDDGVDTGPILAQHFFHVPADETAASLYARHMKTLEAMLAESLPTLADGTARRAEQDERFATWGAKRTPEDGSIDWSLPAPDIWRLIRAVGRPYPGAFTQDASDRLIIWQAAPWPDGRRHAGVAGQVIARDTTSFVVRCGDGEALHVTEFSNASGSPPRLHSRLSKA